MVQAFRRGLQACVEGRATSDEQPKSTAMAVHPHGGASPSSVGASSRADIAAAEDNAKAEQKTDWRITAKEMVACKWCGKMGRKDVARRHVYMFCKEAPDWAKAEAKARGRIAVHPRLPNSACRRQRLLQRKASPEAKTKSRRRMSTPDAKAKTRKCMALYNAKVKTRQCKCQWMVPECCVSRRRLCGRRAAVSIFLRATSG